MFHAQVWLWVGGKERPESAEVASQTLHPFIIVTAEKERERERERRVALVQRTNFVVRKVLRCQLLFVPELAMAL